MTVMSPVRSLFSFEVALFSSSADLSLFCSPHSLTGSCGSVGEMGER